MSVSIQSEANFPVGTVNWGFWAATVRERINKLEGVSTVNLDALEDAEGYEGFEHFISALQRGQLKQMLCMRASSEVETLMNCHADEQLTLASADNTAQPVVLNGNIEIPPSPYR